MLLPLESEIPSQLSTLSSSTTARCDQPLPSRISIQLEDGERVMVHMNPYKNARSLDTFIAFVRNLLLLSDQNEMIMFTQNSIEQFRGSRPRVYYFFSLKTFNECLRNTASQGLAEQFHPTKRKILDLSLMKIGGPSSSQQQTLALDQLEVVEGTKEDLFRAVAAESLKEGYTVNVTEDSSVMAGASADDDFNYLKFQCDFLSSCPFYLLFQDIKLQGGSDKHRFEMFSSKKEHSHQLQKSDFEDQGAVSQVQAILAQKCKIILSQITNERQKAEQMQQTK